MKNIVSIFLVLFLSFTFSNYSFSQKAAGGSNNKTRVFANPLFDLTIANIIDLVDSKSGTSELTFDIFIYHTNEQDSGPFLFAAGQYFLQFDTSVANGGLLTYSIIPNSTGFSNPNAVPVNPAILGNQLRLYRNIPLTVANAPIVSTVYPGTKIVTMKISSTAPTINKRDLNLSWIRRIHNDLYTGIFAFVDSAFTNISDSGTYIIDTNFVISPVELSAFNSSTIRNNVNLKWVTSSEINNNGFDLERSSENNIWEKIGFVKGFGSTSSSISYYFEDKNLNSGRYRYRLKQIDYNGNFEYFNLNNEVNIGNPENFSLKQNYPNPFNPGTKIDFDIPYDENVSLKLYDINGREVKTIINEFKTAGYYTVELNAASLPSGAYYYVFNSGDFHSTKKLVILK